MPREDTVSSERTDLGKGYPRKLRARCGRFGEQLQESLLPQRERKKNSLGTCIFEDFMLSKSRGKEESQTHTQGGVRLE